MTSDDCHLTAVKQSSFIAVLDKKGLSCSLQTVIDVVNISLLYSINVSG